VLDVHPRPQIDAAVDPAEIEIEPIHHVPAEVDPTAPELAAPVQSGTPNDADN
jgi:hypothetical protein